MPVTRRGLGQSSCNAAAMLDLPEQLVPFRTMQVAVIRQGCLKTHASCGCCKPRIQLTGHPEPGAGVARLPLGSGQGSTVTVDRRGLAR